jgi:glycosyltransferase involved in cell wall biosynthesis
MKVAVDARELCGKPTGVGRYLGELLTEWAASSDARRHEWTLYAPSVPAAPPGYDGRVRLLPGAGGTRWEQWTLARQLAADRPDVLFAPGYSAPLTAPCPVVVAIHDVSFAAHPEWFSPREGLRRRWVTRWSATRARIVLTISAFSQREIVARLGQRPDHVRVIPLGARVPAAVRATPREPVILHVGSLFPRRHVDALVDAFVREVAPAVPGARLEIVGEDRMPAHAPLSHALAAADPGVRNRVRFRSYVDEPTLEALYRDAAVFAFLSEYEGFGLTPLEAMARGAAPVVLDTEVSREVYGDAAEFVAPGADLATRLGPMLRHLVTHEEARAALIARAPAVLSRYDWTRTAAATLAVLEEAAGAR